MTVIPFPPRPELADLVVSMILGREAELVALLAAGRPVQDELAIVQALLRLILSPTRLQ